MPIMIHIYYTGANGNAVKFVNAMVENGIVDDIRKETGNLCYDYYFPLDAPETVLLIDRWENQEALDQHHQSPMMQQIALLREQYDLHMKVERYVQMNQDISEKDKGYIRD